MKNDKAFEYLMSAVQILKAIRKSNDQENKTINTFLEELVKEIQKEKKGGDKEQDKDGKGGKDEKDKSKNGGNEDEKENGDGGKEEGGKKPHEFKPGDTIKFKSYEGWADYKKHEGQESTIEKKLEGFESKMRIEEDEHGDFEWRVRWADGSTSRARKENFILVKKGSGVDEKKEDDGAGTETGKEGEGEPDEKETGKMAGGIGHGASGPKKVVEKAVDRDIKIPAGKVWCAVCEEFHGANDHDA